MPTASPLAEALSPLLVNPSRAAVLLDVDGTLAPIVRHADDAHVPEPTRAPLIRIAKQYGLVACVSGRRAAVARRIVSLGSITYVGNHGTEVLRGGTTKVEVDPEIADWAARVQAWSRKAQDGAEVRRLRIRAEDKQAIAAFHWRGAPDEDAAEAEAARLAGRAQAEGFAVHWGRKVLEVRPPVAMGKGRGIARLLEGRGLAVALYAGDDRTDLDAFSGLRQLVSDSLLGAAVCVGVRSEETPAELEAEADVMVDGTAGVRALLVALADAA